ncbi:MAG TPA: FkbM family methyltransferase [Stellaceae bacterium]|nr:FkbM family methyltransferase [Stellaceae bacterium]
MRRLKRLIRAALWRRIKRRFAGEIGQLVDAATVAARTTDQEFSALRQATAKNIILKSSGDIWFEARFNDVDVVLPGDTIRTMIHCIYSTEECPILIAVEDNHLHWMISKLQPGSVFLDVGAATGAMSVPIAKRFGESVALYAFEPARKARALLIATLDRNALTAVTVIPEAVADTIGAVTFAEFVYDEASDRPYLPETSTIHTPMIEGTDMLRYDVPVTTLDAFAAEHGLLGRPAVVKVDVEGFEVQVLRGAAAYLAAARPWLAIDIHRDPFGEDTTEAKVVGILEPLGYSIERMGHVVLASPTVSSPETPPNA